MDRGTKVIEEMTRADNPDFDISDVSRIEAAIEKSMQDFEQISKMIEDIYREIAKEVESRMSDSVKEFSEAMAKANSKE